MPVVFRRLRNLEDKLWVEALAVAVVVTLSLLLGVSLRNAGNTCLAAEGSHEAAENDSTVCSAVMLWPGTILIVGSILALVAWVVMQVRTVARSRRQRSA